MRLVFFYRDDPCAARDLGPEPFSAVVGREAGCDVQITDPLLSRRHLRVDWDGSLLRFHDLESANGVRLNGRLTRESPLQLGDVVQAGETRIRVEALPQAVQGDVAAIHRKLLDALDLRTVSEARLRSPEFREEVRVRAWQLVTAEHPDATPPDVHRIVSGLLDDVFGLGPLEPLLADETVTEIMVNGAEQVFLERGGKLEPAAVAFAGDAAVRRVIDRIVAPLGRRIDEANPMVDARLADGSRVNAVIPPLALNGPVLTIRKFARRKLTADDLVSLGALDDAARVLLEEAVRARRNILISGGTGSGKTTLLNVLSGFIPPDERIVTIEDAAELQLHQPHVVRLESRPPNLEGKGAITIRDLLRNALRMRPDRIIVGECRGGEALDMLQAMNTGHDGGLSTIHANRPADALRRLETLTLFAGTDLPHRAVREQVASAIHLVVQQSRRKDGSRGVEAIVQIDGFGEMGYLLRTLWERDASVPLEAAS